MSEIDEAVAELTRKHNRLRRRVLAFYSVLFVVVAFAYGNSPLPLIGLPLAWFASWVWAQRKDYQ